jgi:LAO/AO transport system kinase
MPVAENSGPLWVPALLRTVATEGKGVAELLAAVARHADFLHETGDWARRDRARVEAEFEALVRQMLVARFRQQLPQASYEQTLDLIASRQLSPWEAAHKLLDRSQI